MNKLKGMFDITADQGYYALIQNAIQTVVNAHHIDRIDTPILEASELFHRGMGDDTDVVSKETYTFLDRGDRSVTLRPEGTAGVVRAFIEEKLYANPDAVKKVYYEGPMFRYERPQKGRFRQFHQFGVEIFALPAPALDADLCALAYDFMNTLGLSGHLEINQLSKSSKPAYTEALKTHLKPHLNTLCPDCQNRYEKNPLRILDCKVDHDHVAIQSAPMPLDYMSEEETAYFNRVKAHLDACEIPYTVNKKMVRGLDYYTGLVFELKVDEAILGHQNTVAGGGRYDELVKTLGGPDLPATGFAFGLERLVVALKEANIPPVDLPLDLYIMVLDDALSETALSLARRLRLKGARVDLAYHGGSMKKQFKAVAHKNAAFAAILGPDEVEKGLLTFKNQHADASESVAIDDISKMLQILGVNND